MGEVKEKVGLDTEAIVKIVEEVISEKYNTEEMERALGNTLSNTLSNIPYFDVVINKNNEYKPR